MTEKTIGDVVAYKACHQVKNKRTPYINTDSASICIPLKPQYYIINS